jgi:hypothetical protein
MPAGDSNASVRRNADSNLHSSWRLPSWLNSFHREHFASSGLQASLRASTGRATQEALATLRRRCGMTARFTTPRMPLPRAPAAGRGVDERGAGFGWRAYYLARWVSAAFLRKDSCVSLAVPNYFSGKGGLTLCWFWPSRCVGCLRAGVNLTAVHPWVLGSLEEFLSCCWVLVRLR